MIKNQYKDQELLDAVKEHGGLNKAADALNIPRTTFKQRLRIIRSERKQETFTIPELPTDDLPAEMIVEQLTNRFMKRKEAKDARKWIPIDMRNSMPIGLLWLGDPHIDDNYCDWPNLRKHIDIIQTNEGIYGCSLGDHQNNWIGRLARLYDHQDTSHKTAWRLVEWLIDNINPLILIGGNHDMWSGAGDPLKWMTGAHSINEDWEARVEVRFPNGRVCRIHAAHDMPGHSQWNPLHAQNKMARFKSNAHLYISGHRHNWALGHIELVEQEMTTWLARARGYKFRDDFALTKGFEQQNFGQAILQVIDPHASDPTGFVHCFADVEQGAEFLDWKRQRVLQQS
jgi:hypothetical protein